MPQLKIFVSSTVADLHAYRQDLDGALLEGGHTPLVQERFGAMPAGAKAACDDLIEECDVFVGLYGFRYGYVPAEGDRSITELEYETARRLGKRCLCYIAAEKLRPEFEGEEARHGQSEEEWKRLRQLEFRQRIDRELVRAEFSDCHELTLQVLADLGRLQGGTPLGWAYADVRERWNAWLDRQAYFFGDVAEHLELVEPRLAPMWADFVHGSLWHQRIELRVQAALDLGGEVSGVAEQLPRLRKVACDAPYHVVRKRLAELPFPALLRAASREVGERKRALRQARRSPGTPDIGKLRDRYQAGKDLHGHLMALARQSRDPDYRRAFLVLGGMGAGKTHFIAHLAAAGLRDDALRDQLFLPLRVGEPRRDLGEAVLKRIREATGLTWRRLEEVDAFLAARGEEGEPTSAPCLVVAVDDLHLRLGEDPGFAEELERFVVEHTHLHQLVWLVTLQDTEYQRIVRREKFWERFTYAWRPAVATREDRGSWTAETSMIDGPGRSTPVVGGWLYLDEINGGEEPLGLEVLRAVRFDPASGEAPLLAAERSEDRASVYRFLASPFVAWVILGLGKDGDPRQLVNLNFVGFVEAFWKRRLSDMGWSPLSAETVAHQAVALVARCLFESGDFNPFRGDMVEAFNHVAAREGARTELRRPEGAEKAIEVLERGGLIRLRKVDRPVLDVDHRVELSFEPLWGWQLARQILPLEVAGRDDLEEVVKTLRQQLEATDTAVLREGLVEFFLLLASRKSEVGDLASGLEAGLWRRVLAIEEVGAQAVWFAGPKAGLSAQRELISWLEDHDLRPRVRKTPFGVLYFLNALAPEALPVPDRLRHLQPLIGEIQRASLGSFYLYAAEHFLRQIDDNETLLEALPYFGGCEELGFAPLLAELAVERAFDNADGDLDALFDLAVAYLRRIDRRANLEVPERNRGRKWTRHFFYEWLLEAFFREVHSCSYDRQILLTAVFDRLEKRHWYRPNRLRLGWWTGLIMEREANISLGHWYRAGWRKADRDGFESIVRRLARASRPDQQVAFFLLYHAGAIGGRPAHRLEGDLLEELQSLLFNPAMARVAGKNRPFFEYQLHPLSASEGRRLEELRRLAAERRAGRSGNRGRPKRGRGRRGRRGRGRKQAGRGGGKPKAGRGRGRGRRPGKGRKRHRRRP